VVLVLMSHLRALEDCIVDLHLTERRPVNRNMICVIKRGLKCCGVFSCRLKITGDMVVSFPAGIVQTLRNNPWSTALSLHVKNISHIDEILMNKQLIAE